MTIVLSPICSTSLCVQVFLCVPINIALTWSVKMYVFKYTNFFNSFKISLFLAGLGQACALNKSWIASRLKSEERFLAICNFRGAV